MSDKFIYRWFGTVICIIFQVYGDSNLAADEKGKMEDSVLSPGNTYAATKV